GPEAGTPVPLEHWFFAVQDVHVRRFPGVDLATGPGQQLRVAGRVGRLPVQLHVPQQRAPPGRGRHLAQDHVRRLVEVTRDLEGQPAVGGQPVRPADQQLTMAGHPLQHRVGDDHVGQALRFPVPYIVEHERQSRSMARRDGPGPRGRRGPRGTYRSELAGLLDHLGRAVHAAYRGRGPSLREQGGQVSWAATHVDHVTGKLSSDPGEQVEERPCALASKPKVKGRVPHYGQSFSNTERHGCDAAGENPSGYPRPTLILLYRTVSLDVKRYALVMGQRAGPDIEADSDDEILGEPLLRDEVDELVAAWRARRRARDVEPMQVLSRISRLARHLDIARRGAFAEHELESWEFDVLSALRRQGPPFQLTPGALLRATLVTSGTMTNRIDR